MNKEVDRLLNNEHKVKDLILPDTTITRLREDFVDDAEQGLIIIWVFQLAHRA